MVMRAKIDGVESIELTGARARGPREAPLVLSESCSSSLPQSNFKAGRRNAKAPLSRGFPGCAGAQCGLCIAITLEFEWRLAA